MVNVAPYCLHSRQVGSMWDRDEDAKVCACSRGMQSDNRFKGSEFLKRLDEGLLRSRARNPASLSETQPRSTKRTGAPSSRWARAVLSYVPPLKDFLVRPPSSKTMPTSTPSPLGRCSEPEGRTKRSAIWMARRAARRRTSSRMWSREVVGGGNEGRGECDSLVQFKSATANHGGVRRALWRTQGLPRETADECRTFREWSEAKTWS